MLTTTGTMTCAWGAICSTTGTTRKADCISIMAEIEPRGLGARGHWPRAFRWRERMRGTRPLERDASSIPSRGKIFSVLLVALLMFARPVKAADLVVLVGWDGADYRRVEQMLHGGELPSLDNLTSSGTFQQLEIMEVTSTKPSWATILSGLPWTMHGTQSNESYQAIPSGWTVFEWLSQNGVRSAYVAGKCQDQ